jgi:type IX secretion system PorP/SprF family membrane protein
MCSLRNNFLPLAAFALVGFAANAQQSALNDIYLFNPTVVDPTFAGQTQYHAHSAFQQKWVGIEGAPRTLAFYGDFMVKSLGIQVGIQSDQAGPVTRTSPMVNVAQTVQLAKDHQLSVGLRAQLDNWVVDYTKPRNVLFDPVFQGITRSALNPNLGLGITYTYSDRAYIGASVLDMVGRGWSQDQPLYAHAHLFAGYFQPINKNTRLALSGVLNRTSNAPYDLNLHAAIQNTKIGSAGLLFSPGDGLGVALSAPATGPFKIYYHYIYPLNALQVLSNQSHTVGLSYRFTSKKDCALQGQRYF